MNGLFGPLNPPLRPSLRALMSTDSGGLNPRALFDGLEPMGDRPCPRLPNGERSEFVGQPAFHPPELLPSHRCHLPNLERLIFVRGRQVPPASHELRFDDLPPDSSTLARSRPPTLSRSDPGEERWRERRSGTGSGTERGHPPILTRSGPLGRGGGATAPGGRGSAATRGRVSAPETARPTISPGVRGGTGRRCGWSCTDGGVG